MPISSNIRILRKKAKLTQIDVAKALGVSIATFRRWEGGETAPTGTRIVELAKVLQVEPESLVSETQPKPVNQAVPSGNIAPSRNVLVFEKGELRIELPATEKGYELFNRLVERLTGSAATA